MGEAAWFVALDQPGGRAEWDWDSLGAPDVRALHSTRRPASGDFSRHIPVTAYATTTGSHHELESGLEHDLLRRLDRDPAVVWLLAQPVTLFGVGAHRRSHTPDLLSLDADGCVTVWDARLSARQDELFLRVSGDTRAACELVGWHYDVFAGFATVTERMNELWLAGHRRSWPWHAEMTDELRHQFPASFRVGEVYRAGEASGRLVRTMWHLAWRHELALDVGRPLRADTRLRWAGGHG